MVRRSAIYPAGTTATVALAVAGAGLFTALGLPAPLLLGAMAATLTASLAGFRLAYPHWFQFGVLSLIGIMVGGSLSPQVVGEAGRWVPSLAAQVAVLVLALGAGMAVIMRFGRLDRTTAFLSVYPGHLMMVIASAVDRGADVRIVAVAQSLRLALLIALLPILLEVPEGAEAVRAATPPPGAAALVPVAAGLAGIAVARALRLPAPPLLGGMAGAGAAALAGFPLGRLPDAVSSVLLVTVGGLIGARFAGTSATELLRKFPVCVLGVLVTLAVMLLLTWGASGLLGLPFGQVLLGYSPGGADVMPLLAAVLGLDAGYVGIHHAMRLIAMGVLLPLGVRLMAGPARPASRPATRPD
ncbi:AbrB family transcriptional regulator [Futiania mangrovi]|uniref:AbrB family transcriptional regulator n=1 Tax=Futiania mangrovi TaxID=2959716 RepID=A0A9J6PDN9_9PROT|nr:AbrB family transcriptional regulator [Futiania mangrovii]MCP1336761.1 AbrB family transcriptional regulator [Futiania mangrovii]